MSRPITNKSSHSYNELESLCSRCYQGEYVLLLGDDVLLNETLPDGYNSKVFFDKKLHQQFDVEDLMAMTVEDKKRELSYFLSNYKYDVDKEVNPDLIRLMSSKCFRIVLTTSYDRYPELVMREIWGDELKVINIYNSQDRGAILRFSEYDIIQPTLVYVMGRADLCGAVTKFAYTEDDVIELIAKRWLDSALRNDILVKSISDMNMLGIGCKFDDWEFRFFWYSLRQDLSRLQGDVAISLDVDRSESDKKLAGYLRKKRIYNKGNARQFLKELADQLADPVKYVYERMVHRMQQGGVFISYASEDFPMACKICKILLEHNCNVWFDNRELRGGDPYNDRISEAINQCKVFIPLLSRQTADDLQSRQLSGILEVGEDKDDRYYMKEWHQMAARQAGTILPLSLPGFDIRKNREFLIDAMKNVSIIDWSADGAVEKLIDSVCDKLDKADII